MIASKRSLAHAIKFDITDLNFVWSRPLSQLGFIRTETNASQPVMNMWSFVKSGVYDKGPRGDVVWFLKAGNSVNLWLDEVSLVMFLHFHFLTDISFDQERMKTETKGEPLLPVGVENIPAFSVCEISIASKNITASQGGSSIKIATVRVAAFSMHSLTSDLQFFSSSLGDARADQLLFRENNPCLLKDLDVNVRTLIFTSLLFY